MAGVQTFGSLELGANCTIAGRQFCRWFLTIGLWQPRIRGTRWKQVGKSRDILTRVCLLFLPNTITHETPGLTTTSCVFLKPSLFRRAASQFDGRA